MVGSINCLTNHHSTVNLKYCLYNGHTTNYNLRSASKASFCASFQVYEIHNDNRVFFAENTKTDTLIEWYLNSVGNTTLFCGNSSINDTVSREVTSANLLTTICHQQTQCFSRDCLYISYNDTGVLLHKVPEELGPKWNNNLAIEYRSIYGRIPDKSERKKIAEFLGFLMGRRLILVGDTYDMSDVLARYWLANSMPVGVCLPILA